MLYKLDVLDGTSSLAALEAVLRQSEEVGFEVLSLAAGLVGGKPANLLTLALRAPGSSLSLSIVDDELDAATQQAALKGGAGHLRSLVCYAGVHVDGKLQNVAAYRG